MTCMLGCIGRSRYREHIVKVAALCKAFGLARGSAASMPCVSVQFIRSLVQSSGIGNPTYLRINAVIRPYLWKASAWRTGGKRDRIEAHRPITSAKTTVDEESKSLMSAMDFKQIDQKTTY